MHIPKHDIEISFIRGHGPGGQKTNVTESGVRIRHVPTGIIVVSRESRSQHRNKILAMAELERRLLERRKRPKARMKTRTPRSVKEKRLEDKKRRGQRKRLRQGPQAIE